MKKNAAVCLLDNQGANARVFVILRRALMDKGYIVTRVTKNGRTASECSRMVFYEARFAEQWNPSVLSYAKLSYSEKGLPYDKAYSVQIDRSGKRQTLLDEVPDSTLELRELVDRLVPDNHPWNQ